MGTEDKTLQLPPMPDEADVSAPPASNATPTPSAGAGLQRLTSGRVCPLCRNRVDGIRCPTDRYLTVDVRAENPEQNLTGTVLGGGYLLEKLISESAHSQVYAATQLSIERQVAVKVRRQCDARHLRGIARFQREARLLGALDHPRIVRLIDMSLTPSGTFFMVLEHLQGESLATLLGRMRLAPQYILAMGMSLADALSAVHGAQLVHRNVIPANVVVLRGRREVGAIKLIDFRLVKELDPEPEVADAPAVTRTGELVGDPRYLAPELIIGGAVTSATDVYGLGLVMYEMLTGGQGPFEPTSSIDAAVSHVTANPATPAIDGRPLAGALVDAVMGFLAKNPAARPKDGAAALDVLREIEALKPQKQLHWR